MNSFALGVGMSCVILGNAQTMRAKNTATDVATCSPTRVTSLSNTPPRRNKQPVSEYIVAVPTLGGWNKEHIWRVQRLDNQARIVPICNKGGRRGPRPDFRGLSWLDARKKFTLNVENPLENSHDYCINCMVEWAHLRTKETDK